MHIPARCCTAAPRAQCPRGCPIFLVPSPRPRSTATLPAPCCDITLVSERPAGHGQGAPPLETSLGTLGSAMHIQLGLRDTGRLQHRKIWAEGTPRPLPPLQCTGQVQAGPTSPAVMLPGPLSTPPTSFAPGTRWCLPAFGSPQGFAASPACTPMPALSPHRLLAVPPPCQPPL